MVRSWHGRSPSQAGARPLSATDAWLEAVAGDKTYVGTICELKQFPAYLNRWDSQQARNEGVFAH